MTIECKYCKEDNEDTLNICKKCEAVLNEEGQNTEIIFSLTDLSNNNTLKRYKKHLYH